MSELWLTLNKIDLIYYTLGLSGLLLILKDLISPIIFKRIKFKEVLPNITSFASGIIVAGVAIKLHLKFPTDIALIIGLTSECLVFFAFGWFIENEKKENTNEIKTNLEKAPEDFQKRIIDLLEKMETTNQQIAIKQYDSLEESIKIKKENLIDSFDNLEDTFRTHLEHLNKMNAIYFKSIEEMTEIHFTKLHKQTQKEQ